MESHRFTFAAADGLNMFRKPNLVLSPQNINGQERQPYMRRLLGLLSLILLLQASTPAICLAQAAPPTQNTAQATQFDLSSTERQSSTASDTRTANLMLGGSSRSVTAASPLTAAERVALNQVLSGGQQSLQLGVLGNAVGGSFRADTDLKGTIGNLIIPQGVTAIHDFAASQTLNILGNLSNAGSIFAVSSNPAVNNATISATNIFNQQGALLTSVLPAGGLAGLSGLSGQLNLTLSALNNIINAGTISSSANLTAIAGGSIINALPQGATGTSPVMQALSNLNLQAATITNSGVLASLTSNINIINASRLSDVVLANLGGRLEALAGAINVRDAIFSGTGNTIISGGDLLARELNIYSSCGKVNVDVGNLLGTVNISGKEAHVSASASALNLGVMNLSGDPTFYNTGGDVFISSPLLFSGAPLSIVASGNIVSLSGAGAIDTSSSTGNGGNILLLAGAAFTSNGPPAGSADTTSALTITGASATGGAIDLSSIAAISALDSRSSAANGSGGNITLAAFPGSAAGSGSIILPAAATIRTGGDGTGSNGNLSLIGGSATGVALSTGSVDTRGGAAGTGNIVITTSLPSLPAGNLVITNGNVSAGTIAPGTQTPGMINTGALSADGATIDIAALGPVLISSCIENDGSTTHDGGTVKILSYSLVPFTLDPAATVTGVQGTISASGGPVSGAGGTIRVVNAGAGGVSLGSFADLNVAPTQGAGGTIALLGVKGPVDGPVTVPSGTLSVNAAGTGNFDGGHIYLGGSDLIIVGGGHLLLSANAVGSGNGGVTGFGTSGLNDPVRIGLGANQISVSATGGTPGSSAGNGGMVAAVAGGDMTVDPAAISLNPLGTNGNGANVLIGAGAAGPGNLLMLTNTFLETNTVSSTTLEQLNLIGTGKVFFSSSLHADGVGTGAGGNILLGSVSTTAMLVGASSSQNGVQGSISALPGNASGSGGTISIFNLGTGGVNPDSAASLFAGTNSTTNVSSNLVTTSAAQSQSPLAATISAGINRLFTLVASTSQNTSRDIRPAVNVKTSGPNRLSTTSTRLPNLISRLSNNLDTLSARDMETNEEPEVKEFVTGSVLFQTAGQDEADEVDELPEVSLALPAEPAYALHRFAARARAPVSNSRIISSPGSQFAQSVAGNIHLACGGVFTHVDHDTQVRSGLGWVEARTGAVLSMEAGTGVLRIKALSGPGHIWIHTGGQRIPLHPGQEILITRHHPSQAEIFPLDGIGRRQVHSSSFSNNRCVTISEFSIIAMLRESPDLTVLRQAQAGADRQLRERLLKVAAAVQIVTGGHGRYYTPRNETGSVPAEAMKPETDTLAPGGKATTGAVATSAGYRTVTLEARASQAEQLFQTDEAK